MSDWKYGTVVRRAVTKRPPVYQYLMFICWSDFRNSAGEHLFRAIRLNTVGSEPQAQKGWTKSHLKADLFEEVPDE